MSGVGGDMRRDSYPAVQRLSEYGPAQNTFARTPARTPEGTRPGMARWIAVPSSLAPRAGGVVRRKRVTARAGDRALAVWADRTLSEAVLLLGADDAVEILRARVVGTGGGVELQAWVLVAEGGEEVVQRLRVVAPPGMMLAATDVLARKD